MAADYDVIVIGAGGAGLAAALSAAEMDASVLIVEAADAVGGSTILSGGVFYAAGTSVQRARGLHDDTPLSMFRYYMTINQWKIDAGMVYTLCEHAAPSLEWLIGLGVRFPEKNLYAAGLDGVLRGHRAEGRGAEIVNTLDQRVSTSDCIDLAARTRVTEFMPRRDGIAGIAANGETVFARSVVLATGGFGADPSSIARFLPGLASYGDWVRYIGAPTNRGDGIRMGLAQGAVVTGHDRASTLLTPNFCVFQRS